MRRKESSLRRDKMRSSDYKKLQSVLGDESVTDDDEVSEDFQSVSTDNAATDYGLEFTGHSLRSGPNTSRKKAALSPVKTTSKSILKAKAVRTVAAASTDTDSCEEDSSSGAEQASSVRHERSKRREEHASSSRSTKSSKSKQQQLQARKTLQSQTRKTQASSSRREEDETESAVRHSKSRRSGEQVSSSRTSKKQKSGQQLQTSRASTSGAQNAQAPSSRPQKVKSNRRKQITPEQRQVRLLKEIKALQSSLKNHIAKLPFSRLIRELLQEYANHSMRITPTALEALQESAELYLTQLFEDAYRCTVHRNRVTLQVKDMELVRYLRGPKDPGNVG